VQVIQRARLILGSDDPALYAALNDLGTLRETQDKGDDAVAMLQEALTGRIRLLGPRDPLVLTTMSNLAMAYERKGEMDRSLQMQIDALKVAEGLPDPPRMTLIGLNNNVGATLQDLNRDEEAAPYMKRAAALATDYLGDEHPDTLTIESNLAALEAELGDPGQAMKLLEHVIGVQTRLRGPQAFDTLTARFGYWSAMFKARRFDEAAAGYAALLPEAETALKSDHWFVAQTRAVLALALLEADRPQEALPHAEKATAQFTALYGPNHERTVNAALTLKRTRTKLSEITPATQAAGNTPADGTPD
jgi:tetratricopeptide (TPR) repeat protein